MNKIAFLCPYFGSLPKWMPFFLASCERNPSIDFIFYCDAPRPQGWPENIRYNQITFQQYKQRVSERLNIDFQPEYAYKLCDIKPAYGLIHADDLVEYDFWGFCDIDLVFGNIRSFLTEQMLSKYEFYSTHAKRVAGHFCVMKNSDKWRRAFQNVEGWQGIFESQQHHAFDEKAFARLFTGWKNYPKTLAKILCYWLRPLSRQALLREEFSTPGLNQNWIDDGREFPTEWYWYKGVLTNNNSDREFLYFHFLRWKRDWAGQVKSTVPEQAVNDCWKVTEKGFEALVVR